MKRNKLYLFIVILFAMVNTLGLCHVKPGDMGKNTANAGRPTYDLDQYQLDYLRNRLMFTPEDEQKLARDKILITNKQYYQMFTPYIDSNITTFITTDSLINGYNVLFRESIQLIEEVNSYRLSLMLRIIWENLGNAERDYSEMKPLALKAKKRARIIIGVARKLLDGPSFEPPEELAQVIELEVKKINEAQAIEKPNWLGPPCEGFKELDYNRFKPRGFYDKTSRMKAYFRAVSWLQAIPFRPSDDQELLMILMLADAISPSKINNSEHLQEIRNYYDCFSDFLGETDDLSIRDVADGLKGNKWKSHMRILSLLFEISQNIIKVLENQEKAAIFIMAGRIGGAILTSDFEEKREAVNELMRVKGPSQINDQLGQLRVNSTIRIITAYRFPDGVLFTRVISPGSTPMNLGLMVAVALGSEEALNMLHPEIIAKIQKNNSLFEGKSMYIQYLNCLKTLFDKPHPNAPEFMSNLPWKLKSINAVLAGWAQMCNTWALQRKQVFQLMCMGGAPPPAIVEPNPEFFHRLNKLIVRNKAVMDKINMARYQNQVMVNHLENAIEICRKLSKMSMDKARSSVYQHYYDAEWRYVVNIKYSSSNVSSDIRDDNQLYAIVANRMEEDIKRIKKGENPKYNYQGLGSSRSDALVKRGWETIEKVSADMERIANKQLKGVKLNEADEVALKSYGENLVYILLYNEVAGITPNDDAPRIIDVFCEATAGRVIEAGVGRPSIFLVLYPFEGKEILCIGAVMPYYEFSNHGRLTDKEWIGMLSSENRPQLPQWIKPIVSKNELRMYQ